MHSRDTTHGDTTKCPPRPRRTPTHLERRLRLEGTTMDDRWARAWRERQAQSRCVCVPSAANAHRPKHLVVVAVGGEVAGCGLRIRKLRVYNSCLPSRCDTITWTVSSTFGETLLHSCEQQQQQQQQQQQRQHSCR